MSNDAPGKTGENPLIGYGFVCVMLCLAVMCGLFTWQWSSTRPAATLVANVGVMVGLFLSCLSAKFTHDGVNKTLLLSGMVLSTVAQIASMYFDHLESNS